MKIHCPGHEDETPSCHVYPDGYYCFVCGYRAPIGAHGAHKNLQPRKDPENVKASIQRILRLPKKPFRGLEFHYDDVGFYILWPNQMYYKKRLHGGSKRYLCPSGTRAPLFSYERPGAENLVLVEGELNTASLVLAFPNHKCSIASPGSCGEFERHYSSYLIYKRIIAIVDYDPAGVGHGKAFKERLMLDHREVELLAVKEDFNDVLQRGGVDEVKKEAQNLGLSSWL